MRCRRADVYPGNLCDAWEKIGDVGLADNMRKEAESWEMQQPDHHKNVMSEH